ncbi:hypothetical protein CDG77_09980 [Nostoc sp. 'Peltigera membranacea cyanobiont' 213]|uniref:hypothetical protein n=1 Tax=unclassified Nostoc TaxID=2593658 RepID=UPI000B95936C|nr:MULTISPECIES: hypothetical protein [unclassified Nostoc]AVH66998.1 hypothetical protein NPM_5566 [Nostoc sp. 'Peltigera membranacea cyanobiont' N6]OYD95877.1 hypothetical protein CDG77_09980 [Nostoc sp. 'Peltigera membranacea cyanobiont' 213]
MSQQSFVEYYESFLAQPGNSQLREALDATESGEFARIAVEQGQSNGFEFNADDVKSVMVSAERKVLGLSTASPSVNIRSINSVNGIKARPANRELSENELESVAGGMASSTVKETVMCCW